MATSDHVPGSLDDLPRMEAIRESLGALADSLEHPPGMDYTGCAIMGGIVFSLILLGVTTVLPKPAATAVAVVAFSVMLASLILMVLAALFNSLLRAWMRRWYLRRTGYRRLAEFFGALNPTEAELRHAIETSESPGARLLDAAEIVKALTDQRSAKEG
jgi:hypothetical protein